MENIAKFLEGCEKLGCPKHDLFQTIDLYENKNPGQVVDAIWSLSRHAAKAGCNTPVRAFLSEFFFYFEPALTLFFFLSFVVMVGNLADSGTQVV